MDTSRLRYIAVFVALLCFFAVISSERNRISSETFLNNGVSWNLSQTDVKKAERVWISCRKELKDATEALKDLHSQLSQSKGFSYDSIEFDSTLVVTRVIMKAVSDLTPEKKESVLQCLREKNLPSEVLRAEEETWLNKYQKLSDQASVPRRYLRRRCHVQKTTSDTFSALLQANMALHTMRSLSSSPVRRLSFPALPWPSQAPQPSPPQDYVKPPSPSYINYPSNLPENFAPSPSINEDKSTKYIVAPVVPSTVAGVALLAVFSLCCLKKKRNTIEPKDAQKNESPPLSFCDRAVSADDNPVLSEKANFNLPLPPGRTAPPQPPAPPPPPPKPPAPPPPPPPKVSRYPNSRVTKPSPLGPDRGRHSSAGGSNDFNDQSEAPKTKLKPFFWDKVLASPDHSMVWNEIRAGSFQFDEEMMETLFGYVQADKKKNENRKDSPSSDPPQIIQIIDARKSHNLAILLRALNMSTEEVCDALSKGHELPAEFIQPLLKMAPTSDEELKLKSYSGDVSHLGPADRLLKVMVDIPFAFKRLESLLFVTTFQEEVSSIKETLATLEVACKELRSSRLFLKLLEAVLKTGNRMNDGTYRGGAQAFKLDTLLKLSDVKGTDGKTTLLHFVVQEIIRSEGLRAARQLRESSSMLNVKTEGLIGDSSHEMEEYHRSLGLQVVSALSNELENVRRAALFDTENLSASISKLGRSLVNTREFLDAEMKSLEGYSEFRDALDSFVHRAESDIVILVQDEERIMALVKSTGDYFHGKGGNDESSRLFVIVRDFLLMLDQACKDVKNSRKLPSKIPRKEALTATHLQRSGHEYLPYYRHQLFPAVRERRMGYDFSSDDES